MTEKTFQSIFSKWIKQNYPYSAVFELKVVDLDKKKSISFSKDFQPHQIPMLQQAKHGCVYKKLSDIDPSLKPFDSFQCCFVPAFIVILFYQKRKKKIMYWVDVDMWLLMQENADRKSATEEMVIEYSQHEFIL